MVNPVCQRAVGVQSFGTACGPGPVHWRPDPFRRGGPAAARGRPAPRADRPERPLLRRPPPPGERGAPRRDPGGAAPGGPRTGLHRAAAVGCRSDPPGAQRVRATSTARRATSCWGSWMRKRRGGLRTSPRLTTRCPVGRMDGSGPAPPGATARGRCPLSAAHTGWRRACTRRTGRPRAAASRSSRGDGAAVSPRAPDAEPQPG